MTLRTLIHRSLRFHWRSHLGVVLGAAIGSAALIGALVVGDSVKGSLRERSLQRLGRTEIALSPQERFFRWNLAENFQTNVLASQFCCGSLTGQVVSLLRLPATALVPDGTARANKVNVMEVDSAFGVIASDQRYGLIPKDGVLLSHTLADKLGVKPGNTVLLRVRKPSAFSIEVAVSTRSDPAVALRLRVHDIVSPEVLGNFDLSGGSQQPLNAFVAPGTLQFRTNGGRIANIILDTAWGSSAPGAGPPSSSAKFADLDVQDVWQFADTDHSIVIRDDASHAELRTPRIFVDPPIVHAALTADTNAQPILTYLVNLLSAGTNTTPYSMVTAAGAPWTPADMRDDEIIVSRWLADDLRVKPGDEITLSYFDPESGTRLTERTNTFRVHAVVPMEMPWTDRTLMPDFPGIEKAESTRDWDAGFPLVYKIRQKDEDYWKQHRGTPKAFVTLAAGQKMWANRFGNLTAIRFPIPTNGAFALTPALSLRERKNSAPGSRETMTGGSSSTLGQSQGSQRLSPLPAGEGQGEGELPTNQLEPPLVSYKEALEKTILANLRPEELGLRFEPVREQALKAAEESQDFGGLFLGFSLFLIVAALLLMAMLFQFGLEQRIGEIGTLLALGFTPKQVRRLLLGEAAALAFIGAVLGVLGGIAYAKAMLHGLTTVWRDAVGASALNFHITMQTLVIGLFASIAVSVMTIGLALRKCVKRPARELLTGEVRSRKSEVRSRGRWLGAAAVIGAVGLIAWTLAKGDTANAGAFFGAGALLLIAGLSFVSAWLAGLERRSPIQHVSAANSSGYRAGPEGSTPFTLASLGIRGCARRRTRSLSTIAMLACGSFLIVSIGVFRLDANRDATKHSSGTGGFALIGETTMPVVHDLNTRSGRDFFALNQSDLEGVSFVPFRVHEGDEASCLNLNAAQKPRLLGVKPQALEGRFAFSKGGHWESLIITRLQPSANGVEIPAIGDANSIEWAMHKKVGDTIDYVDERGQPFKVRIVGAVANSILQGSLIIDEAEFLKRFPGESGYRTFLIDVPSNSLSQVSATLSRAMQDVGLELTPAPQRLAQFNAVQNTYLGTFQVLGGLGLLLGSVGLGIVVLRNVLERRAELAVLLAVGYTKRMVRRLLLIEHGALLAAGLTVGILAAAVAVLPSALSPGAQLPYRSLTLTLAALLANGSFWTWVAARAALRGNLLAALRNE